MKSFGGVDFSKDFSYIDNRNRNHFCSVRAGNSNGENAFGASPVVKTPALILNRCSLPFGFPRFGFGHMPARFFPILPHKFFHPANPNAGGDPMKKYRDMYELFKSDSQAKEYFDKLPDYVRDQISTRADGVNSFASLQDYAENLLRGDN